MNYAAIKYMDVANGPGVRTSLFVSGCTHNCPGCFNSEAQDFNYGKPFTEEVEEEIISSLRNGLTILGGEPMEITNATALAPFLDKVRKEKPDISIWLYSGFTFEELMNRTGEDLEVTKSVLKNVNILVDGRFILNLKSIRLQFRGSSNQRVIDLKKTLSTGEIVIWENLKR
jgi:anaerobic ribonucleoside-triphosphate reductase activating protein